MWALFKLSFAPLYKRAAFILFIIALIDVRLPYESAKPFTQQHSKHSAPVEGSAIYLLLDHSGSMAEKVLARTPLNDSTYQPKIDLLKLMAHAIIEGDPAQDLTAHSSDMLGVIALARSAEILMPLTLDHAAVLRAIDQLEALQEPDTSGTVLGYAIFKGASLIEATRHYAQKRLAKGQEPYTLRDAVMILITDGFQDPSKLDRDKELRNIPPLQAAEYAKTLGVRLYIINIDPKLASNTYAAERHQMEMTAELTGGKFFLLNERGTISDLYRRIDELEKSFSYRTPVIAKSPQQKPTQNHLALYPYFIGCGMALFAAALLLQMLPLRRWP